VCKRERRRGASGLIAALESVLRKAVRLFLNCPSSSGELRRRAEIYSPPSFRIFPDHGLAWRLLVTPGRASVQAAPPRTAIGPDCGAQVDIPMIFRRSDRGHHRLPSRLSVSTALGRVSIAGGNDRAEALALSRLRPVGFCQRVPLLQYPLLSCGRSIDKVGEFMIPAARSAPREDLAPPTRSHVFQAATVAPDKVAAASEQIASTRAKDSFVPAVRFPNRQPPLCAPVIARAPTITSSAALQSSRHALT